MLNIQQNHAWLKETYGEQTNAFLDEKEFELEGAQAMAAVSIVTDGNDLTYYRCVINDIDIYELVFEDSINAWMDINSDEVSATTEALGKLIEANMRK